MNAYIRKKLNKSRFHLIQYTVCLAGEIHYKITRNLLKNDSGKCLESADQHNQLHFVAVFLPIDVAEDEAGGHQREPLHYIACTKDEF